MLGNRKINWRLPGRERVVEILKRVKRRDRGGKGKERKMSIKLDNGWGRRGVIWKTEKNGRRNHERGSGVTLTEK